MDTKEFISSIQKKYNYSNEMVELLEKAIPTLVNYYGEDKKEIIYGTLDDCEIHIQGKDENIEQYLNQYFNVNEKWDLPLLATGFHDTELLVKDNEVYSKTIIFLITQNFGVYKPFDFNDTKKVATIIHELCHAIKSYGKIKVENGEVITHSGLIKSIHPYDASTNSFQGAISSNTGLEEALNSYDEAEIMTMMTGTPYESSGYSGMMQAARGLMKHKELAEVIRKSQFTGGDEWKEFLGQENADLLAQNFEEWVNILYRPIADFMDDSLKLLEKKERAEYNLYTFIKNYTTPTETIEFQEARKAADKKTVQLIEQTIMYNNETNQFEQIEPRKRL